MTGCTDEKEKKNQFGGGKVVSCAGGGWMKRARGAITSVRRRAISQSMCRLQLVRCVCNRESRACAVISSHCLSPLAQ